MKGLIYVNGLGKFLLLYCFYCLVVGLLLLLLLLLVVFFGGVFEVVVIVIKVEEGVGVFLLVFIGGWIMDVVLLGFLVVVGFGCLVGWELLFLDEVARRLEILV